eukprot:TCONS_00018590-protein
MGRYHHSVGHPDARKIKRVCRSTLMAETMALLEVFETCLLLAFTGHQQTALNATLETTEFFTDSKSLFEAAHSTTTLLSAVRECIKECESLFILSKRKHTVFSN